MLTASGKSFLPQKEGLLTEGTREHLFQQLHQPKKEKITMIRQHYLVPSVSTQWTLQHVIKGF